MREPESTRLPTTSHDVSLYLGVQVAVLSRRRSASPIRFRSITPNSTGMMSSFLSESVLSETRSASRRLLVLLVLFVSLSACDSAETRDDRPEITLLAAYTPAAEAEAGDIDALIRRSVDDTNEAYENSRIPIRLVLVHVVQTEYALTDRIQDLQRLVRPDDGHLDEIHALRDEYEADLVVLVAEERSSTINAAVMADAATAFAVVHYGTIAAPDFALAHELGHLQGARHTPDADPNPEPFAFGHAFRNDSIKTIMSTGGQPAVPYFSGPDQTFEGVVLGDSTLRNAAEALRRTAVYVSNFRGPQTPTDFVSPGTWPTADY